MVSANTLAGVTQLVECQLPKLNVAGSNPVSRLPKTAEFGGFFFSKGGGDPPGTHLLDSKIAWIAVSLRGEAISELRVHRADLNHGSPMSSPTLAYELNRLPGSSSRARRPRVTSDAAVNRSVNHPRGSAGPS